MVFLIGTWALQAHAAARRTCSWGSRLRPKFDVTVVSFYGGPQVADLEARGVRTITVGKKHH